MNKTNKTVVIFGVFDSLHEGHNQFIKQAKKLGSKLVVIVALDKNIVDLKNKKPKYTELVRLKEILKLKEVNEAFLGDEEVGIYKVLIKINPQIIFLGYDQQDLYNNLKEKINKGILPKIDLIFGKAHKPKIFHSSILNKYE